MSAIAGILHLNGEPVSLEQGNGMMKAFEKFPANDVQTWRKDHVFLGCHAQWITPESIGEVLPFYDYARQLAITADAIIDNRDELYQLLQIHNEDRKNITDSQLILLAYHKWGEDCPKHLVGDFAFMIWDEKEQKLFGARDFSGSRTLYYLKTANTFFFSTLIKPILKASQIKSELNEVWLADYLAIGHMIESLDTNLTAYENIYQLPPSHSISVKNERKRITRYHTFNFNKKLKLKNDEEYAQGLLDVLTRATNDRLRTWKPVGSQLSGGLDSGTIASIAAVELRKKNERLHTFSYVPEGNFTTWMPSYRVANEAPNVNAIVQHSGNMKSNIMDFAGVNSLGVMEELLELNEMPYKHFENSFWVHGINKEASSQGIGILLNGSRGNLSISWGPPLDYYTSLAIKWRFLSFYKEYKTFINRTHYPKEKVNRLLTKKILTSIKRKFQNQSEPNINELVSLDFRKRIHLEERFRHFDVQTFNKNKPDTYNLRKEHFTKELFWIPTGAFATKMSVAFSIWSRDPSNDRRVIDYCLSIPELQYVKGGLDRSLIRRATKGLLPEKIRMNTQTRGVQGSDWIHRMRDSWVVLFDELNEMLLDSTFMEYVNKDLITRATEKLNKTTESRDKLAFDLEIRALFRAFTVYKHIKINIEGR